MNKKYVKKWSELTEEQKQKRKNSVLKYERKKTKQFKEEVSDEDKKIIREQLIDRDELYYSIMEKINNSIIAKRNNKNGN